MEEPRLVSAWTELGSTHGPEPAGLGPHSRVRLCNLGGRQQLNGVEGIIISVDDSRAVVQLENGSKKSIKLLHLQRIDDEVVSEASSTSGHSLQGVSLEDLERRLQAAENRIASMDLFEKRLYESEKLVQDFISQHDVTKLQSAVASQPACFATPVKAVEDALEQDTARLESVERLMRETAETRKTTMKLKSAHGRMSQEIATLRKCLQGSGVVAWTDYDVRLHRSNFEDICTASKWTSEANISVLADSDAIVLQVLECVGPAGMMAMRASSTIFNGKKIQASVAQYRLQEALALTVAHREDLSSQVVEDKLRAAILMAEAVGEEGANLELARFNLRKQTVLSRLAFAMAKSETPGQLQTAIAEAEAANLVEEVEEAYAWLEVLKKRFEARQKLRIAVSWATSRKFEQLEPAIQGAETAGLDSREIDPARSALARFRDQGKVMIPTSASIPAESTDTKKLMFFLMEAKPTWKPADLQSTVTKLQKVRVHTVSDLILALRAKGENSLVSKLIAASLKAFTQSTLDALRYRSLSVSLSTEFDIIEDTWEVEADSALVPLSGYFG